MKNIVVGLAPVVLFVYNRPEHTRLTIEALLKNKLADQSELYIFSDGPKTANDKASVEAVRTYLQKVDGFKQIHFLEQETNHGLAKSIINGVTQVVNAHDKIIVLEDDIITSPYFLQFMNNMLNLYENDDRVASVSGYMFPIDSEINEFYFLPMISSWGWGTWKSSWDLFEADGTELLSKIHKTGQVKAFNLDGTYPYFNMLRNQAQGKNNSWAVRWNASLFINKKLSIWPSHSLVTNIGFDGSGTHCNIDYYTEQNMLPGNAPATIKKEVQISTAAYITIKHYLSQKSFSRFSLDRYLSFLRKKISSLFK